MSIPANGTDAKDIAIHFVNMTTGKATPSIMKKTINQAKTLLGCGYSKSEIIDVIDYLVSVKNVEIFSLGYVNVAINNVLREMKKHKAHKNKTSKISLQSMLPKSEVINDDESSKRNQSRLNRFGLQPRFGEKFAFDMFEG